MLYFVYNQKARNVYGTNLISRSVDSQTAFYLYNGHADVVSLIDGQGNNLATYYYDAFGNITEQTGTIDNNITYAGYQYDKETGLYYLNARMYDPVTARFLQEDTYSGDRNDPLSLNLYTYCHNEPIMYWDYSGHVYLNYISGQKQQKQDEAKIVQKFFFDRANYYGADAIAAITYAEVGNNNFGYYGPTTKQAVKEFQKLYDLDQNGIVNDVVWNKMGLPQYGSDLYNWMLNSWNTIGIVNGRNSSQQLAYAKGIYNAYPSYFSTPSSSTATSIGRKSTQFKLPAIFNDNVLVRQNPIPQTPKIEAPRQTQIQSVVKTEPSILQQGTSLGVGFVPVAGDIKDVQETLTGVDLITGEKLSTVDRTITGATIILPVVNGKAVRIVKDGAVEVVEDAVKYGEKLAKDAERISGSNLNHLNGAIGEAQGYNQAL